MMSLFRTVRNLAAVAILFARPNNASAAGTSVEQGNQHGRELQLADSWRISLVAQESLGDYGARLTFDHGDGGPPGYKIYGKNLFDTSLETPTGETCRSEGGTFQGDDTALPQGMNIVLVTGQAPGQSILDVGIADKDNLSSVLMQQAGGMTVIQYCVLFFLENSDGEETTVLETEIRVKIGLDGSITVGNFDASNRADPGIVDYVSTVSVAASICGVPDGDGNQVVSICLECSDSSMKIDEISSFVFQSVGTPSEISQVAFDESVPKSLTLVVPTTDGSYRFDTLLKAAFFGQEATTVVGEGVCTLTSSGRRRLQQSARIRLMREEEDVPVGLAFVIESNGRIDETTTRNNKLAVSYEEEGKTRHHLSTATIVSLTTSLIAVVLSILSFVAVGILFVHSSARSQGVHTKDSVKTLPDTTRSIRVGSERLMLDETTTSTSTVTSTTC